MTKAQEVGARIAQARREKGVRDRRDVKPVDVARALGVSGAAVSDWETGKAKPRDEMMEKLAAFLGTTPGYLRFGERSERIELPPGVTSMEFDGPVPEPGRVASGNAEGAAKRPKGGHRPRRPKASGDR